MYTACTFDTVYTVDTFDILCTVDMLYTAIMVYTQFVISKISTNRPKQKIFVYKVGSKGEFFLK